MTINTQRAVTHSTDSSTVADLLERILDKGVVITGDIKIKLVDIELLSLEIRLVVCSVDKAVEMGIDWWKNSSMFLPPSEQRQTAQTLQRMEERMAYLEQGLSPPR